MLSCLDMSAPIRAPVRAWPPLTRVAFRFSFCYLSLCCLSLGGVLINMVFLTARRESPQGPLDWLWRRVVPFVGEHVFHQHIAIYPFGSSDAKYDYLRALCELTIAIVATFVWSVLDRKRRDYAVLHGWLRFVVTLILSGLLISYGTNKVFPVQFGTLTLERLSQRIGDLSPMDLLWAFMAGSKAYTIFAGATETAAGILLLIPSLTTVGALISIAAMTNVFMLNLSYGVPVKVISFHMLLLSIFLVVPQMQRLADVLVFNRAVDPVPEVHLSRRPRVNRTVRIVHAAAGVFLLIAFSWWTYRGYMRWQARLAEAVPFHGIWSVDQLNVPPDRQLFTAKLIREMKLAPGDDRWQQLIFASPHELVIRLGNGALDYVNLKLDEKTSTATLADSVDPGWKCTLAFHRSSDSILTIDGAVNGTAVTARLHRLDSSRFSFEAARFSWFSDPAN